MTPEKLKEANAIKTEIESLERKLFILTKVLNIEKLKVKIEDSKPSYARCRNDYAYEIDYDVEFENVIRLKLNSDMEHCKLKIKTLQEQFDNL